jgi:hypothetical protein
MIAPAAYVLPVPEHRRGILLGLPFYAPGEYATRRSEYLGPAQYVTEPVPSFDHSRRAPLIVLACFEDGAITHIADGRKGASAGTGLVRLNMSSLQLLARPILFDELISRAPARLRRPLGKILDGGGQLPPKSLGAVIDALLSLEPGLSSRLERFSERRAELLARLTRIGRSNLAVQKETLTVALQIAGIETEEVLTWSPSDGTPRFFLEGLPEATVREDAMLASDFADLPGFSTVRKFSFAAKMFQSRRDPRIRLKVMMANRLPLEQQTGADLIYYNETYRSFVMVQYKAMEQGSDGPEFRWGLKDQLADEIARMDGLLETLKTLPEDRTPASFRLHTNPFFLKLCPKIVFNPDDKGLVPGMYLPLDLWKSLASDPVTEGPRGGRFINYDNVGRKLTNPDFVTLAANAWVGTTVPQSVILEKVIETIIQSGKTVTFAVKSQFPSGEEDDEQDLADLGEELELE